MPKYRALRKDINCMEGRVRVTSECLKSDKGFFVPKIMRRGIAMNNIIEPLMFSKHTYTKGVEVIHNTHKTPELLEEVEWIHFYG